jgi:hypothetical protein
VSSVSIISAVAVEHGVHESDELVDVEPGEELVEAGQHGRRVRVHRQERTYGGPHLCHGRRRLDASSHHVTHEHGHPAVGERRETVEVATGVGPAGREVPDRHLPPLGVREPLGKDRLLQAQRHVADLRVQLGVVDGDRSAAGEILAEGKVLGPVPPTALPGHPGDHAEDPAVHLQRDRQGAPEVQVEQRLPMLLVDGGRGDHLVGDVRDQLADPGARDLVRPSGCVRVGWVALLELADPLLAHGVRVRQAQRPEHAVLEQLDDAPVREPRDRQPGDRGQRCLVVQAAGQLGARVSEEGQLELAVVGRGDRADARDGLGTGVGEDAEELQLGPLEVAHARERQGHPAERLSG